MDPNDSRSEDFSDNDKKHSPFSMECVSINGIDSSAPSCRICQSSRHSELGLGELLVSPCDCRGSLGFVHKHCMESWLRVRNQDTCELCHFKFETERRFKPFREWQFTQVLNMLSSNEKGVLILGFINFLLLLLEIPFLYYVFRINSKYFLSEINNSDASQDTPSEVYILLMVLLLFFSGVLLVSSITFTVFGFKVFRKVLRFNKEVILVIPMRRLEKSSDEEHVV